MSGIPIGGKLRYDGAAKSSRLPCGEGLGLARGGTAVPWPADPLSVSILDPQNLGGNDDLLAIVINEIF